VDSGYATSAHRPETGFPRRLAASAYEGLLLGALAMATGIFLLLLGPDAAVERHALTLPTPGTRAISFVCLFAVFGVYCVGLWSNGRRTLPMRAWGLALCMRSGGAVSPGTAAWRYIAAWIGPACAIAAYLALGPYGQRRWAALLLAVNYGWALVDRDRAFLHDRLAGTTLVRHGSAMRAPVRG
jgi:uncharacterized RDD family membrane protein YckC